MGFAMTKSGENAPNSRYVGRPYHPFPADDRKAEGPFYFGRMRTPSLPGGLIIALLILGSAPAAPAQSTALPEGALQLPPEAQVWKDAPNLPPGTRVALLEGDPKQAGMFTLRLRMPAGVRLQPHWHPRDERVTILSGLVKVGFGDRWVEEGMTTFGSGSFYLNPANSHHYVQIMEEAVMQLTGMGPWELHFLEP